MFQNPHRRGNRFRAANAASCSPFGRIRRPFHAPTRSNPRGHLCKMSFVRNQERCCELLQESGTAEYQNGGSAVPDAGNGNGDHTIYSPRISRMVHVAIVKASLDSTAAC